jgi:UDP-N-acetylmuramoylalanine--D-glutamate ligase
MAFLVILGGGESGVGTAILGQKMGYDVFVSDKGKIKEKYKNVLSHYGIDWEEENHSEDHILEATIVMKSPGIPDTVPLVKQLVAKGIPVISEIEFAAKYTDAKIIGITGSNGKTTTTMLTDHLLKGGGLDVGMAGNIGDSFAKMVANNNFEYYVLEISSFQLDGIQEFRPDIAVITNIRITMNQTEKDYLIYDADDEVIVSWLKANPVKAKLMPFSLTKKFEEGTYLEDKNITIRTLTDKITMTTDALALEGQHNIKNTMAGATIAKLVSIRKETIRECISNFQGAPHRLEMVLKINHVQYINDSKATNVNATYFALDSVKTQTVWVVGGVDKGNDYTALMSLVREKVKAIVCLGMDNTNIKETFGNVVDLVVETYAMEEAVKVAYKIAERGDTVLLSPACASFDLFENYEDRGNQFKNCVKNL